MKYILGNKLGMTQVFKDDGTVVPVTRVQAGPCVVTQVKTKEKDGVNSVQLGFGVQKSFRLNKPQQGHLKGLTSVKIMREVRMNDDHGLKRGDTFTAETFKAGEKVQVVGWSKGRGFQGVVKRHGFGGSPASHGHKDQLRMPGSIGATDAARVFKGTRMGGHMGDNRVTVKNLEIVEINPAENEILIKGAVPGARGGFLIVANSEGNIEIVEDKKTEEKVEEVKNEEVVETKTENTEEKKPVDAEGSDVVKEEAPAETKEESVEAAEDKKDEESK